MTDANLNIHPNLCGWATGWSYYYGPHENVIQIKLKVAHTAASASIQWKAYFSENQYLEKAYGFNRIDIFIDRVNFNHYIFSVHLSAPVVTPTAAIHAHISISRD